MRAGLVLGADAVASGVALPVAVWLRFECAVPDAAEGWIEAALPLAVAVRVACNAGFGIDHWSFRTAGLSEAVRIALASVTGSALLLVLAPLVVSGGLPPSLCALELFMVTALFSAMRFGPRVALRWRAARWPSGPSTERAVVVGEAGAADLLARTILRDPARRYALVGLASDDPAALGWRVAGVPVLGGVEQLPVILGRLHAEVVLLADAGQPPERVRRVLDLAAGSGVRFKIARSPLDGLDRSGAGPLDDLGVEHLLPRPAVAFDQDELRAMVRGRRALVTGAGGSIGSELCRQLAGLGVARLVMVDINENGLYLGARRLLELRPDLDLVPVVADVREAAPLLRLGMRSRPDYVFHAAAHKHVPLMELVPEEAVKNNVFGTLNVAAMAHRCGAERFVLISTDKAVRPSSVMGATKRVAELVVRYLGRTSPTRMTAVRFGNVLNSAGSVVPIFREQISRGGPVTVTDRNCTRYFMTIPEAVGLVLLAGLGDHGELCILDMGEPIRIDELARHLITLSGRVVGAEIPIVYTGLRPGEKLTEELLTEEEERTEQVRDRIHVARYSPTPADFPAGVARLWRAAHQASRAEVIAALRSLVPTYQEPGEPSPAPSPAAEARRARAPATRASQPSVWSAPP